MRPISVRNSRYNQHVSPGALLVEMGAAGGIMEYTDPRVLQGFRQLVPHAYHIESAVCSTAVAACLILLARGLLESQLKGLWSGGPLPARTALAIGQSPLLLSSQDAVLERRQQGGDPSAPLGARAAFDGHKRSPFSCVLVLSPLLLSSQDAVLELRRTEEEDDSPAPSQDGAEPPANPPAHTPRQGAWCRLRCRGYVR